MKAWIQTKWQPPQPWEFRSKPAWQRLIIMLGGVFVNFVLGIFIYICLMWAYGEKFLPNDSVQDGVWVQGESSDRNWFAKWR